MWKKILLHASVPLIYSSACVVNNPPIKVSVEANANRAEATSGDEIEITYGSRDSKSCSISSSVQGPLKSDLPTSGAEKVKVSGSDLETFEIHCLPGIKEDKAGSAYVAVKVFPMASASLVASSAQIYLGDKTELTWACENSEKADLLLNGKSSGAMALKGDGAYSPDADTEYNLVCENPIGQRAEAKTKVIVIPELAVKPSFESLAGLESVIDVSPMKKECGPLCIYQQFDGERFVKTGPGTFEMSEGFRAEVAALVKPDADRVQLLSTKAASVNVGKSLAYGHRKSIQEAGLSKTCEESFPYRAGASFISAPEFSDKIESGEASMSPVTLPMTVAYDIEVSATATRGVIKRGSNAAVSYKLASVSATREADFTDYDRASGSYRLKPDGSLVRAASVDNEEFELLRSFPAGYPVPPAANGYTYDPNHGTCKTSVPQIENKRVFNTNAEYCGPGSPFRWELECEPGSGKRPPAMPYTYVYYTPGQPFSAYAQPVGSLRVVQDDGQVQCDQLFPGLAATFGLGSGWIANAKLQYFVTDSRWPACGGSCAAKEERTSENDWRFGEIEPGKNFCVDRWAGLDWNQYRSRIETACTSTPAFIAAKAKYEQGNKDTDFANACVGLCKAALEGMRDLASAFSVQALTNLVEREKASMESAKASGVAYLITEEKLSPVALEAARKHIAAIKSGIDAVQNLHSSKGSDWAAGNQKVHFKPSIQGFDSYTDAKATVEAYDVILQKAEKLILPDVKEIACSYEMRGRFRKFNAIKNSEVSLVPAKQESFTAKVKEDTMIE